MFSSLTVVSLGMTFGSVSESSYSRNCRYVTGRCMRSVSQWRSWISLYRPAEFCFCKFVSIILYVFALLLASNSSEAISTSGCFWATCGDSGCCTCTCWGRQDPSLSWSVLLLTIFVTIIVKPLLDGSFFDCPEGAFWKFKPALFSFTGKSFLSSSIISFRTAIPFDEFNPSSGVSLWASSESVPCASGFLIDSSIVGGTAFVWGSVSFYGLGVTVMVLSGSYSIISRPPVACCLSAVLTFFGKSNSTLFGPNKDCAPSIYPTGGRIICVICLSRPSPLIRELNNCSSDCADFT